MTKISYFGTDGEPVLNCNGIAGRYVEYDARGNKTNVSYFGTDGEPILNSDGIASWSSEYDAQGNLVKLIVFGIDGNPVMTNDGYAGTVFPTMPPAIGPGLSFWILTATNCDGQEL